MFKIGDAIKNTNPSCMHYGSRGIVLNSSDIETEYMVLNNGANYKEYDILKKTNDQLKNEMDMNNQSEAWHTSKMYATPDQSHKLKDKLTVKFGKDADDRYAKSVAASKNNIDLTSRKHVKYFTGPEKDMLMKKLTALTQTFDEKDQQDEFLNIFKEELSMDNQRTEFKNLYEKYNRLLKVHSHILNKESSTINLEKQSMIESELESVEEQICEQLKKASTSLNENKYGEGWMIKAQLYNIVKSAAMLYHIVDEEEDFEDWIQYKITLAEDYILTAAKFIEFRKSQEGSFYDDDKSHYNE